jgi:hypothetical protein
MIMKGTAENAEKRRDLNHGISGRRGRGNRQKDGGKKMKALNAFA